MKCSAPSAWEPAALRVISASSRTCARSARRWAAAFRSAFLADRPRNYRDALQHQREQMLKFIAAALRQGVYFHDYGGAACHHGFCHAMTIEDAEEVLRRLDGAAAEM